MEIIKNMFNSIEKKPKIVVSNEPNISKLSAEVQKATLFTNSQGYRTLRIVIRGARKTGKTTLFERLQGKISAKGYYPSDAIKATSISWSRGSLKTVFDIWDVIDEGKKRQQINSLGAIIPKINQLPFLPLDSTTIEVYNKDCDGVIFIFDRNQHSTFDYVKNEIKIVPKHIPIIICSNFSDLHRQVTEIEEKNFINSISPAISKYHQNLFLESACIASCIPPLLINTCIPHGVGMISLHTFFEAVLFYHRARETETYLTSLYKFANNACAEVNESNLNLSISIESNLKEESEKKTVKENEENKIQKNRPMLKHDENIKLSQNIKYSNGIDSPKNFEVENYLEDFLKDVSDDNLTNS